MAILPKSACSITRNQKGFQQLISLRETLIQFSSDLFWGSAAYIETHLQTEATLSLPFSDSDWRNSPLFRHVRILPASEGDYLNAIAEQIDRGLERLSPRYNFDEQGHQDRESLAHRWSMLPLLTLAHDPFLMEALTLGTLNHELSHFVLRLCPPLAGLQTRLGRDWGGRSQPIRWSLGPYSVYLTYAAYLLTSYIHSDFEPQGIQAPTKLARRRIFQTYLSVVKFLSERQDQFTVGDLLLADGLISALLNRQASELHWNWLAPLIRLSPLTSLCHLADLLKLAGDDVALYNGLHPHSLSANQPGLLRLVGCSEIPGVQHRMAQHIADACQPSNPPALLIEMGTMLYYLLDQLNQRVAPCDQDPEHAPTEADYQSGALILRAYHWADIDQTLPGAIERLPDFGAGFRSKPVLDKLYEWTQELPDSSVSDGQRFWLDNRNRAIYIQLKRWYDDHS